MGFARTAGGAVTHNRSIAGSGSVYAARTASSYTDVFFLFSHAFYYALLHTVCPLQVHRGRCLTNARYRIHSKKIKTRRVYFHIYAYRRGRSGVLTLAGKQFFFIITIIVVVVIIIISMMFLKLRVSSPLGVIDRLECKYQTKSVTRVVCVYKNSTNGGLCIVDITTPC